MSAIQPPCTSPARNASTASILASWSSGVPKTGRIYRTRASLVGPRTARLDRPLLGESVLGCQYRIQESRSHSLRMHRDTNACEIRHSSTACRGLVLRIDVAPARPAVLVGDALSARFPAFRTNDERPQLHLKADAAAFTIANATASTPEYAGVRLSRLAQCRAPCTICTRQPLHPLGGNAWAEGSGRLSTLPPGRTSQSREGRRYPGRQGRPRLGLPRR